MSRILSVVLVTLLITLAVANTASAQEPNQGNPTVLNAVQNLQSSVDALASQVANITNLGGNVTTQLTAITNQLTALGTPPTVVSTGFSFKPVGYSAGCNAQNVGTSPVTVSFELRKIDGTLQQALPNVVVGPGQGSGFGQSIGSAANHLWCRIVMVSGSSANIRGHMDFIGETTGLALVTREAR